MAATYNANNDELIIQQVLLSEPITIPVGESVVFGFVQIARIETADENE